MEKIKTLRDAELLNYSTALNLGLITWDQYFELVLYDQFKIAQLTEEQKAAALEKAKSASKAA